MHNSHSATADIKPHLERLFRTAAGNGRCVRPLQPLFPGLRKGVVNRILYYTGSFNPPHAGHLAALKHAVKHCGDDYNMVAIVVEVTHNTTLWQKFRDQPGTLLLTSLERLLYWDIALLEDEELRYKCWAIGSFDFCGWESGFEDMVLEGMASSGFDIRVAHLVGGDSLRPDPYSMEPFLGPSDFIVPNISRPVEFQDTQGRMTTLSGCEQWERIQVVQSPSEAVVWSCKKQGHTGHTIRFVSSREPMSPSPSSTAVRRAIETSKPEELDENLHRSGALTHGLLAMAIRDRKRREEREKKEAVY